MVVLPPNVEMRFEDTYIAVLNAPRAAGLLAPAGSRYRILSTWTNSSWTRWYSGRATERRGSLFIPINSVEGYIQLANNNEVFNESRSSSCLLTVAFQEKQPPGFIQIICHPAHTPLGGVERRSGAMTRLEACIRLCNEETYSRRQAESEWEQQWAASACSR